MTPITHAILPLVIGYAWIPKREHRPAPLLSAVIAFGGAMPDVLNPHISLEARYTSWSHSIIACAGFAVVMFAASTITRLNVNRRAALLCSFAYTLHIVVDLLSGGGRPLLPFSAITLGGDFIPSWAWGASDLSLLLFVYFAYRWYPLRRRYLAQKRFAPPPFCADRPNP